MKTTQRPKTLTASVGAKHTPEEERRIKIAANNAGLTVSEWSRQTHLEALQCPPWSEVLLREIMALRRIVVALQLDSCQGHALTRQRLQAIVDSAETDKAAMAAARLNTGPKSNTEGAKE